MRDRRRLGLAATSGSVGVACALAPWLPWLSAASGRPGHCGWTCHRPATATPNVALLPGRGGAQVAPVLSAVLLALALLVATVVVLALVRRHVPVVLGRALVALAFAALVGTVLTIVRYAEGGTLVRTDGDGLFVADLGVGAVVALAASSAALLLGGGVALRAPWASAPERALVGGRPRPAADEPPYPCSSRS